MDVKLNVVILAAGKGTRMYSATPKVLHQIAGRALLQHSLDTAKAVKSSRLLVVIGHEADKIREAVTEPRVQFILQEKQLGTGHAVQQTLDKLDADAIALILYGDVPLIKPETLRSLVKPLHENSMAVLTCIVPDPGGLGRIIRNSAGAVEAIVEEKDASTDQKQIREINTGIMAIPVKKLHSWLPLLKTTNAQGEYYLTDTVAMAVAQGCEIFTSICHDPLEVSGVNNRQQLAQLERHYQEQLANQLMLSGVTLRDPARLDIRGKALIEQDVSIDINVILEGKVTIGSNVTIGPNCVIRNSSIGEGTAILANSLIEDSIIGMNCSIGPFARIRPGTQLGDTSKIGNFVEIKKSTIGKGSKINHLSYVGDSNLGENVNIGAGTITCNYDGANKHLTRIGNNVFIGSNSALVAPVVIGDGATIAAGSIITKQVNTEQLAIARARQTNIDDWKRPVKKPQDVK